MKFHRHNWHEVDRQWAWKTAWGILPLDTHPFFANWSAVTILTFGCQPCISAGTPKYKQKVLKGQLPGGTPLGKHIVAAKEAAP